MLRDGDTELDAPLPNRFVVVRAVESDRIDVPSGLLPIDPLGCAWNLTLLIAAYHNDFETPLRHRIIQLFESFVRRLTRNDRSRREP